LHQFGVHNLVVDSSSIEVNRRLRRAKADNLDAVSLVGLLIRHWEGDANVWSVVTVPGADDEDHRQPHRELNQLRRERTTHTNRIRGLLATVGIKITAKCLLLPGDLDSWRQWNGEPSGEHLKRRLLRELERLELLTRHIRAIEAGQLAQIRDEAMCMSLAHPLHTSRFARNSVSNPNSFSTISGWSRRTVGLRTIWSLPSSSGVYQIR
jgi:transposase